jgi:hypothetical protein
MGGCCHHREPSGNVSTGKPRHKFVYASAECSRLTGGTNIYSHPLQSFHALGPAAPWSTFSHTSTFFVLVEVSVFPSNTSDRCESVVNCYVRTNF